MAHYRKIDSRIWNDRKFRSLSKDGKLVFFLLLTHPHMTALGAMRATPEGLAAEMGWPAKDFREAFEEALSKGMAKYDPHACFVWLPNFLKYNRPESPNVVKAWAAALDLLPECRLKDELIQDVKAFTEGLTEAFQKALPEVFAKSMPNQEQEQEQEQKEERTRAPREHVRENADRVPELIAPQSADADSDPVHAAFLEVQRIYPDFAGRKNWIIAEHHFRTRVERGESPTDLLRAVERYALYVKSGGASSTAYVLRPETFFSAPDKPWQNSWEPPQPLVGALNGANSPRREPRISALERVRRANAAALDEDDAGGASGCEGMVVDG